MPKFKRTMKYIFESYKDVNKVNSKIQKIKKELDEISSDTENGIVKIKIFVSIHNSIKLI